MSSIQVMRVKFLPFFITALLAATAVTFAHHSTSSYDMTKQIEATGTVKEWYWGYPHTLLTISVSTPGGKPEEWIMEAGPPGVMLGAGWSKTSWNVGDKVSVKVHPRRREPKGGFLMEAKRANGEVLTAPRPPE